MATDPEIAGAVVLHGVDVQVAEAVLAGVGAEAGDAPLGVADELGDTGACAHPEGVLHAYVYGLDGDGGEPVVDGKDALDRGTVPVDSDLAEPLSSGGPEDFAGAKLQGKNFVGRQTVAGGEAEGGLPRLEAVDAGCGGDPECAGTVRNNVPNSGGSRGAGEGD